MRWTAQETYSQISEATSRLQDDGGVFRRFTEKYKLDRVEFWLVARFRYFPGSATPNDFSTFGPYTSVSHYQSALDRLVEKAIAERAGEGRYRLAESARKAIGDTYHEYFMRVARNSALPGAEAEALYALADRVYTAALRQSDVPTPILNAAHSVLPDMDSIWVQLERRLVGLMIFRDESHIAAWRDAGYTGPRVELSTTLFGAETGMTIDELREAASRLDDKDFMSALSALHSGSEVAQRKERYRLTLEGRETREAIEAATDANYARAFAVLSDEQFDQMAQLLKTLAGPPEK